MLVFVPLITLSVVWLACSHTNQPDLIEVILIVVGLEHPPLLLGVFAQAALLLHPTLELLSALLHHVSWVAALAIAEFAAGSREWRSSLVLRNLTQTALA